MLDDVEDHEPTTFEMNPLGNRQRLRPRDSFLARAAVAPPITVVIEPEMIVSDETIDDGLVSGDHTISDVVLPSTSAVMLPAMAIATPVPSLCLPPAALLILPKEIHYPPIATPYYPPTESHHALSIGGAAIASRRVRYLAVPAIAILALVVLGGAMIPPDVESMSAPVADVRATQEATSAPRIHEIANEPPAPVEEVAPVKPVVRPIAKRVARPGKIVVNTSSALGNLRVRKW